MPNRLSQPAPRIGNGGDPGSLTAVVNKARSLAAAYAPADLRRPAGVGNALPLRDEAASAAERMAAEGITWASTWPRRCMRAV